MWAISSSKDIGSLSVTAAIFPHLCPPFRIFQVVISTIASRLTTQCLEPNRTCIARLAEKGRAERRLALGPCARLHDSSLDIRFQASKPIDPPPILLGSATYVVGVVPFFLRLLSSAFALGSYLEQDATRSRCDNRQRQIAHQTGQFLRSFHKDDWIVLKRPGIPQPHRAGIASVPRILYYYKGDNVLSRVSKPLAKRLSSLGLRFHFPSLWILWILSHFVSLSFLCDGGLQGSCCSTLQLTLFDHFDHPPGTSSVLRNARAASSCPNPSLPRPSEF